MSTNLFLDSLNDASKRQSYATINSHWNKFCFFAKAAKLADPITWKVEDFTKELLGKYATWLVTCGKAGKPLQSYRLYLCGLKTKVESIHPSTHEKSVLSGTQNGIPVYLGEQKGVTTKERPN